MTAIGDKLNTKRAPTPQHHYAVKYYTLNNYYIYDTLTVISSADSEIRFIRIMYFLIRDVALIYGPALTLSTDEELNYKYLESTYLCCGA